MRKANHGLNETLTKQNASIHHLRTELASNSSLGKEEVLLVEQLKKNYEDQVRKVTRAGDELRARLSEKDGEISQLKNSIRFLEVQALTKIVPKEEVRIYKAPDG